MSRKPERFFENKRDLEMLCEQEGYDLIELDKYHFRILGATHIIDIWPSRMVYHRVGGEDSYSREEYHRNKLDFYFNKEQVKKLLETGRI